MKIAYFHFLYFGIAGCVFNQNKDTSCLPNIEKNEIQSSTSDVYEIDTLSNHSPLYNTLPSTIKVPKDMVFVPGGVTFFGSKGGYSRETPQIKLKVQGFLMDKGPVTVAAFRKFINQTKYITQADSFGNAGVFDIKTKKWILKSGANWEFPLGKEYPKAMNNHPVTQVSWHDAKAYCKWMHKRLPTELEWEFAARSGGNKTNTDVYFWGDSLVSNSKYMANTWNGPFPDVNLALDGYLYTSPVGAFNTNTLGLQDMLGNVWEWCEDWYLPYPNADNLTNETIPRTKSQKAQRGGSFLCSTNACLGYRITARSGSTPETSLFHIGFRCVKDI